MRKYLFLLGAFSLLAACATPTTPPPTAVSEASATPDVRSATLSELTGDVNGRARPDEALVPVNVGFQLKIGGEVRTGTDARARLDFSDDSILRLSANSSYTLQAVRTADDGSVLARIKLTAGRIWVSLFGGELEVETPLGVASVRGSFAVFTYDPGDPNDPNDDVLVVDCIEGDCGARSSTLNEQLSNMERLVLGGQTVLRLTLTGQDVLDFLQENPESQRMVATLTAAPPVNTLTATATALPPTATHTPTSAPEATNTVMVPTETATSVPTTAVVPPTPNAPLLGTHTVRQGETLFCIGRGYGVLPEAIAAANGFAVNATLTTGAALRIPSVRWPNAPAGPMCGGQFASPFVPTATPTPTAIGASNPTSTPTGPACAPNEFFDPVMRVCRPIPATNTPISDTQGPSIAGLNVSPNPAGPQFEASCSVMFDATVADPSGVSLVDLEWTAYDSRGAIVTSPTSTPLTLMTFAPNAWQTIINFDLPANAFRVEWRVSALDNAGNSAAAQGPSLTIVGCSQVTF